MMQAARSSAAAILKAAGTVPGTEDQAVEFVERFSGLDFDKDGLGHDLRDPMLPTRLRGDIVLVSEDLRDAAVDSFLAGMADLAAHTEVPAAGSFVVEDCTDIFRSYRKRRRRR